MLAEGFDTIIINPVKTCVWRLFFQKYKMFQAELIYADTKISTSSNWLELSHKIVDVLIESEYEVCARV